MAKPYGLLVGGVFCAFALGGCVLPAAVSIASFAFDGVSYLATGKSVQDHAISVVADEDCALWRVVAGRSVCVEKSETAIATLPVQAPVRTRDGMTEPTGLEVAAADSPVAPSDGDERSAAPMEASHSESPPKEAMPGAVAAADDAAASDDAVEVVEVATVVVDDSAPVAAADTLSDDAGLGGDVARAEERPRLQLASASENGVNRREPGGRPEAKADARRVLAAKTAGVGPFALASDGIWRPIDADQPRGLVATFDAALGSEKGFGRTANTPVAEPKSVYLVFGTFADSSKAATATRRYAEFTTRVLRDSRDGRSLFRVVTGPYAAGEADSARKTAAENGAPHVWLLRL